MRIWLSPEQQTVVLRAVNGRGGFQSLLRRIQRSWDPGTSTINVAQKDLEVILRELGRRGPKGGFQQRFAALEPTPAMMKSDLRRTPLKVKRA